MQPVHRKRAMSTNARWLMTLPAVCRQRGPRAAVSALQFVRVAGAVAATLLAAVLAPPLNATQLVNESALTRQQLLGKRLFFDAGLSHPGGQSCASCHDPSVAFTDPEKQAPTSNGVHPELFGKRNAPSAMYMAFSPVFHFDPKDREFIGGQFSDGRAATLEEQAKAPFLNPLEMANPDRATVIQSLSSGTNAALFLDVYGLSAFDDVDSAFDRLAQAIAAYERTADLAPFSSKFDAFTQGRVSLSQSELHGMRLFNDPAKANCARCHTSTPMADGTPALFTNFSYANIGVPKNAHNGFYNDPLAFNPDGTDFRDLGLGVTTGDPRTNGTFKVTTLRNVATTGPFTHNGYFRTLDQVVDFYATRDVKVACTDALTTVDDAEAMDCWPAAEVPGTLNHYEAGNLTISTQDRADIVSFLTTLTDGYTVPEPTSLGLSLIGLAALCCGRRRRHGN